MMDGSMAFARLRHCGQDVCTAPAARRLGPGINVQTGRAGYGPTRDGTGPEIVGRCRVASSFKRNSDRFPGHYYRRITDTADD